jgi:hypothetical protein
MKVIFFFIINKWYWLHFLKYIYVRKASKFTRCYLSFLDGITVFALNVGSSEVDGLLRLLVLQPGPGIDSPHLSAQVVLIDIVGQLSNINLRVALRLQKRKIFQ